MNTQETLAANSLSKNFFPDEYITDEFLKLLKLALKYNSMLGLNYSKSCWENFVDKQRPFGLIEIELAIGLVMSLTPNEIGCSVESYTKKLKCAFEIQDMYFRIKKEHLDRVKKKV